MKTEKERRVVRVFVEGRLKKEANEGTFKADGTERAKRGW